MILPEIEAPPGWLAAARVMIRRGWETVEDIMAEGLPGAEVAADCVRAGDIASYEDAGETHLAVRVGDAVLAPGPVGLIVVDRRRWRRGWKVG